MKIGKRINTRLQSFFLIIIIMLFLQGFASGISLQGVITSKTSKIQSDSLTSFFVDLSSWFYPTDQVDSSCNAIYSMARELKARIKPGQPIKETAAQITEYLFYELRFQYYDTEELYDVLLLPSILKTRKANCTGLAQLYLILGELLELPFSCSILPSHVFIICNSEADDFAIETTDKGALIEMGEIQAEAPGLGDIYARKLNNDETKAVFNNQIGVALFRAGKAERALGYLKAANNQFKNYPDIKYNLGNVNMELGKYDDAFTNYNHCIDLEPDEPEYHIALAEVLFMQEKYDESVRKIKQVLKNDSSLFPVVSEYLYSGLFNMGIEFAKDSAYKSAAAAWEECLNYKQEDAEIYYNLCLANYKLREFENAWKYLKKAEENGMQVDLEVYNAIVQGRLDQKYGLDNDDDK